MSEAGPLHPLVASFADAERYDRGRPRYGPEAATVLMAELGLSAGDPVLELGAGTGQLSGALLQAGLELIAVEPLPATRELLERKIGSGRVRAGVAEEIPLRDDSVKAVFAADAFHWFDERRTMPELRRVLQPGSGVAILRSFPLFDAPWTAQLGEAMRVPRDDHPIFGGERGAAAALADDPAFGDVRELRAYAERTIDGDGLLAYVASISWIARLPAPQLSALLERVQQILDEHRMTELSYRLEHQIWIARLL